MKKYIYTSIVSFLILGFASCSDFLDEEPKSNMDVSQYFKNGNQATAAVNKLYDSGLPTLYDASVWGGATIGYGNYMSGYFDNERGGQEVVYSKTHDLSFKAGEITDQMNNVYQSLYEAIGRANAAIYFIPTIEDNTFSTRSVMLAEAKFFRAFNYFHLVKFFGGVPLTETPFLQLESYDKMQLEKSEPAIIYNLIIQDLTDAIADLPEKSFLSNGSRIAKPTAQTLLSAVYLQMSGYPLQNDNYANAATQARSVINSGLHSLAMNKDLSEGSAYNLLRTDNNLSEYIYFREKLAGTANSSWTSNSAPNAAGAWEIFKYSPLNGAQLANDEILSIYATNDLRIQEKQFFYKTYTYTKNGTAVTQTLDKKFPWYYFDTEAMLTTGNSGRCFPIFRYAEVLLIAAESIAKSEGVTNEAANYLAQVRARAFQSTANDYTATVNNLTSQLQVLSTDDFVKEVWGEKLRELMLDCKVWDDVQRTHMYPMFDTTQPGKVSFVEVVGAVNPTGATFQSKHLLWPFSITQLQKNPNLVQNPGYESK